MNVKFHTGLSVHAVVENCYVDILQMFMWHRCETAVRED